jgi:hypothetical protein
MPCKVCSSGNQIEFTAEMMIHFSGLRNIDNPGVLVFPRISICLDCGCSRFTILETELALLRGTATLEASNERKVLAWYHSVTDKLLSNNDRFDSK